MENSRSFIESPLELGGFIHIYLDLRPYCVLFMLFNIDYLVTFSRKFIRAQDEKPHWLRAKANLVHHPLIKVANHMPMGSLQVGAGCNSTLQTCGT